MKCQQKQHYSTEVNCDKQLLYLCGTKGLRGFGPKFPMQKWEQEPMRHFGHSTAKSFYKFAHDIRDTGICILYTLCAMFIV